MEKKISTLLFIIMMLHAGSSFSQSLAKYQDQIYQSYISGEMKTWQSAVDGLERLYETDPSGEVLYNLLLSQYGLTGYFLGIEEKDKAREMIEKMETNLRLLENYPEYESRLLAFRGAWLGFRIGLNSMRAVILGPRSMNAIDEALELDSSNPTAHLEKGNALFYAPSVFGGSKSKAIEHYKEALKLMEQQQNKAHRWLYLSTLVSLANAYESTDNVPEAVLILKKALQTEPDFRWVKNELLPQMMKKL